MSRVRKLFAIAFFVCIVSGRAGESQPAVEISARALLRSVVVGEPIPIIVECSTTSREVVTPKEISFLRDGMVVAKAPFSQFHQGVLSRSVDDKGGKLCALGFLFCDFSSWTVVSLGVGEVRLEVEVLGKKVAFQVDIRSPTETEKAQQALFCSNAGLDCFYGDKATDVDSVLMQKIVSLGDATSFGIYARFLQLRARYWAELRRSPASLDDDNARLKTLSNMANDFDSVCNGLPKLTQFQMEALLMKAHCLALAGHFTQASDIAGRLAKDSPISVFKDRAESLSAEIKRHEKR